MALASIWTVAVENTVIFIFLALSETAKMLVALCRLCELVFWGRAFLAIGIGKKLNLGGLQFYGPFMPVYVGPSLTFTSTLR